MSDKCYTALSTDDLLERLQAAWVETRVYPWGKDDCEMTLIFTGRGVSFLAALLDALKACEEVTK